MVVVSSYLLSLCPASFSYGDQSQAYLIPSIASSSLSYSHSIRKRPKQTDGGGMEGGSDRVIVVVVVVVVVVPSRRLCSSKEKQDRVI